MQSAGIQRGNSHSCAQLWRNARMDHRRLFFGLSVPAPLRSALARVAEELRAQAGPTARATAQAQLHLTLAFLGDIRGDEVLARALDAGGRVHASGFTLALDQAAGFGPTWFLAPTVSPPELLALQAALARELAQAGFALERRAFHPHLSVVRRAAHPLPHTAAAPIAWPVADFVLFESRLAEHRYLELARWPLALGPTPPPPG